MNIVDMIHKAMDEIQASGVKIPYTKELPNGLWEVFNGDSVCFMGKEQYELYIKALKGFA